jgi:hypothetical protein
MYSHSLTVSQEREALINQENIWETQKQILDKTCYETLFMEGPP